MILPDLVTKGLKLIFCGTAASHASATRGHYYAGPGNRFWPLLFDTGLTPRLFQPADDHLLPSLGIGLTDLAKTASGMDHDIPRTAYTPNRLHQLITTLRPQTLAFTSLTAAKIALGARHPAGKTTHPALSNIPIWVLPSPSGAARATFTATPWHDLATHIRHLT
ncbi:G/U mismatch-specific uracil-DNA glycosylase [Pseudorhodobacter antarcticus]|jgi:TDG/mug DNA glycosylase family protein|uniref:G/U mismatch-specific uracil-DNA glycosylase n=1 Tax=Pseudorhodobacter antarcticus TaxID=1077947 RepID=A0A1H8JU68_9RHOB|nr:mismatch-specific DNA-glycosylase [Pseudorhodobacter antarcticus]SEN84272.1 G/U mismatch-specific uracil-DNA glycosylase [Pseudorhodobacter antarcticus]